LWRWAITEFRRPRLSRYAIQYIIEREDIIRGSSGTKKKKKLANSDRREGKYPVMERKLAKWIRETRELGIPVESWMLPLEGRLFLDEIRLGIAFAFSSRWRRAFFKRFNFTYRCITSNNAMRKDMDGLIGTIAMWHIANKIYQEEVINDPEWGRTPPTGVFNRDQVPIALTSEHSRTIDTTGREVVWDSTSDDADAKRFCSLNLTVVMEALPDLSNVPPPHLIFKGTNFCAGEDWVGKRDVPGQPLERDLWNKDVTVSFQENAWCDARTNIYGLKQQAKLEEALIKAGIKNPQQFEDNLSAHLTYEVLEYWKREKPNWGRRSYPPKLTWCMQAIDRHIGIIYKTDVYRAMRAESLKRLNACVSKSDLPAKLTAREKRILITDVVAATHKRLAGLNTAYRAFIATGTWLPLSGSKNKEVELQGVPTYKYSDQVTLATVQAHRHTLAGEEKEAQRIQTAKNLADETFLQQAKNTKDEMEARLAPIKAQGNIILSGVKEGFEILLKPAVDVIASHIKRDFTVYGSYPAALMIEEMKNLSRAQPALFPQLVQAPTQFADIDVVYGTFNNDGVFDRKAHKKFKLNSLPTELNLVEADNIPSGADFLQLVDINAVAICCEVKVVDGKATGSVVYVHPAFWKFALAGSILEPIRMVTPAQTCIRLAFKAYINKLTFNFGALDPCVGEFYKSHREKVRKNGQDPDIIIS
jgi:hypothetical protein